jgi:hypothetical protein
MTVLFADFGGEGAFWVQNGSNIASHAAHFTAGLCKSRDMHAGALAVCMSHARRSCRAGVLVAGFTAGRVLTIGHGGSLTSQSGYTIVQWLWQLHIPSLSPAAGFWSQWALGLNCAAQVIVAPLLVLVLWGTRVVVFGACCDCMLECTCTLCMW